MQTLAFLWFELEIAQQSLREFFVESQLTEVNDGFRAHGLHDVLSQNTISTRRTYDFSDTVANAITRP